MPYNRGSYQVLNHNKKLGVYTSRYPQKVLSMQDPYNPTSCNTYIATLCESQQPNSNLRVLENYNVNKKTDNDYLLIEYKEDI